MKQSPARAEIWLADLNPTRGREQAGMRPCLIVSVDLFNQSPAELAIVIPITSRNKGIRSHVPLVPPEGGVREPSYIKCEDVRSISSERLVTRWGKISDAVMRDVEYRLRILMGL
ncbi:type II toxin-antitoxin system PemK/MazF family toxin [Geotalea uraniireducens]|uniref:mRNA interferase n=1 Tax=Geotalea uraniireducens (strain Rf4) TaxID=351605 RepID=A5GFF6_GEOUR|nr:type II toxin-antitoxin system PemK/MazF family toxin [Geotalea uraniireducens]ABQ26161.1 transcriptional modulator of MazE/toxin, MazF [Geotalea uraniireducens Rf4]